RSGERRAPEVRPHRIEPQNSGSRQRHSRGKTRRSRGCGQQHQRERNRPVKREEPLAERARGKEEKKKGGSGARLQEKKTEPCARQAPGSYAVGPARAFDSEE